MALLSDGGPITVRLYKRKSSNPAIVWANTYEFTQTAPGSDSTDYIDFVNALANAEAELHYGSTQYIRGVVSTLVPDGEPYNPLSFVAVPLDIPGGQDETGVSVEPLQLCFRVAFQAEFGRQGYRLYRNALAEADVSAPGGVPVLDFGATATRFATFQAAMAQFVMDNPQWNLVLAAGSNIRSVTGLTASGVTVKKFNNRYFDQVLR